jgi:hypothetical protein
MDKEMFDMQDAVNLPIGKVQMISQDKVFVSATIKLGLKNYSSVDVTFGITHNIDPSEDPKEVADKLFDAHIVPALRRFAGVLANNTLKMVDIIQNVQAK